MGIHSRARPTIASLLVFNYRRICFIIQLNMFYNTIYKSGAKISKTFLSTFYDYFIYKNHSLKTTVDPSTNFKNGGTVGELPKMECQKI